MSFKKEYLLLVAIASITTIAWFLINKSDEVNLDLIILYFVILNNLVLYRVFQIGRRK